MENFNYILDNNNFSHILCIKIWSDLIDSHTNYANIETKVKDEFLKKEQIYHNIPLEWRKIEWSNYDKVFSLGDLVINSPFGPDLPLVESVTSTIYELNQELHKSGRLSASERIIFKIVKPLVHRVPIPESVGFIH